MKYLLFLALFCSASANAGPIQKVLQLLEDMKAKVQAEGEVETEQFTAYSEWCTKMDRELGFAIETSEGQEADASALIEQSSADVMSTGQEIEGLAAQISKNEADLAAATKVRDAERADFEAAEKELTEAIDQCTRAASVLKRAGAGSSAIQTALSQVTAGLSTVLDAAFIDASSKRKLSALLESSTEDEDLQGPAGAPTAAAYENQSHNILDTVRELRQKAETERGDLRKDEMTKQHNYDMLKQSLVDAMKTRNGDLKQQQQKKAAAAEVLASAQGDLAAIKASLSNDRGQKSDTAQQCAQKSAQWEERKKSRAEELDVITQAIGILGAEDVQGATSRRLGFVQVKSKDDVRERLSALLQSAANRLHSVGLAQLATRTRLGEDPFGKVRKLITDMITKLQVQAAEEADKKQYCDKEKAKSEAKRTKFSDRVDMLSARVDKTNAEIAKLKDEIATLSTEVSELEQSMAEATKLRINEKSTYDAAMADYKTSTDALSQAISVLQEYFSSKPALVQQPQVFDGAYQSKSQGATGIIGMLEVAQADIAKQTSEAEANESAAVSAFNKMKQDTKVTLTEKNTSMKGKHASVNRLKNALNSQTSDLEGTHAELDAVLTYLEKLRGQCEHKPMTFAERAQRRESEIASLHQALEILDVEAGASLLQKSRFMHKQ